MKQNLFVDFVNSEEFDGRGNREDRWLDDAWRQEFLEKWRLPALDAAEGESVATLMDLRRAIRSIADRLDAGQSPARGDLDVVNQALASSPMVVRLHPHGGSLTIEERNTGDSTAAIAGAIALSAARFLASEETDRLKLCDNSGCRWMFYDDTKNRSRRWCRVCGNVDKVRRFRQRQRATRLSAGKVT